MTSKNSRTKLLARFIYIPIANKLSRPSDSCALDDHWVYWVEVPDRSGTRSTPLDREVSKPDSHMPRDGVAVDTPGLSFIARRPTFLLKNQASMTSPGLVSGLRFRVPILDLNQINSSHAQPIVPIGQALLRSSHAAVGGSCGKGVKCVATKVGIVVQAMVGWTCRFLSNPNEPIVEKIHENLRPTCRLGFWNCGGRAGRECAGARCAAVSDLDRPTGRNGDQADTAVRGA